MIPNQVVPVVSNLTWLIWIQQAQSLHDRFYCSDVAQMSPTARTEHLILLMSKYVMEIQAKANTADEAHIVGKRITDLIITAGSLLTMLNVSIGDCLDKMNPSRDISSEIALMSWLNTNYAYTLSETSQLKANDVYQRGLQYQVAMPYHLHQMLEAIESIKMMNRSDKGRSIITNGAMHIWIQSVISHHRHNHNSFVYDVQERMHEVEKRSLQHASYGLFPDYNGRNPANY